MQLFLTTLLLFCYVSRTFTKTMRRVAVVTGSNKGIGFEVARKLCQQGIKTILACRNADLGCEAASKLRNEGFEAEFRQLDIGDKSSISQFAEQLQNDYPVIDILVNNAAIAFKAADPTPFAKQARPTIFVNYFGTLWTTEALLPLIRKSEHPRIVNVASQVGHLNIIKSNELRQALTDNSLTYEELNRMMENFVSSVEEGSHLRHGWPNTCYGTSKCGVIALTKIMARAEPGIIVNACCPGYCATDMSSHRGTKTAEEGARTPAMLALLPDGSTSGGFFSEEREVEW